MKVILYLTFFTIIASGCSSSISQKDASTEIPSTNNPLGEKNSTDEKPIVCEISPLEGEYSSAQALAEKAYETGFDSCIHVDDEAIPLNYVGFGPCYPCYTAD